MSFIAPVISPPAPPPWARNQQRTLVYHEVAFLLASDEIQTITQFWDTFVSEWGCGIEYGREIYTEITWPGWHVYGGTYWFDYRSYLQPEDPSSRTIAANEDNKCSYILKHRIVSKSVCTFTYLLQHIAELRWQGNTIRIMGLSTNSRYPLLSHAQGGSSNQSWRYELNEDQDEDFSTLEDLHQWQQAADIPNSIGGNNTDGSSHNVTN